MGLEKQEKEIGLEEASVRIKLLKGQILKNNSVSPVREYIKSNFKMKNAESYLDYGSDMDNHNKTYDMKRKAKEHEKSLEEKAFYKNEKLRDQKRLKRRKELEKQIRSRLMKDHNQKLSEKFEGELSRLEKLKTKLKSIANKNHKFIESLRQKVNQEQYMEIVDAEERRQKEMEDKERIEREKAQKRRDFLKQKRIEYDQKYRSKR